jgi:hypothetical protein
LEGTGRLLATCIFASLEDARLIAAAPDLLSALAEAYEWMKEEEWIETPILGHLKEHPRAALLRKIEGVLGIKEEKP